MLQLLITPAVLLLLGIVIIALGIYAVVVVAVLRRARQEDLVRILETVGQTLSSLPLWPGRRRDR